MDVLAPLLFLGVIELIIFVIFSNLDLVTQKRKNVEKINGKLPHGSMMRRGYITMAVVGVLFLNLWAHEALNNSSSSGFDVDDFDCSGCRR